MGVLGNVEEIHETIYEDGITSTIAEMGPYDTATINVPIDSAKLASIKARDNNALFVTVEIESGWSQSKRNWKPERVRKIVEAVNKKKPVGCLGHPLLKDTKAHETEFPKPQVVWLGATHTTRGEITLAYIKGYVLPSAEAREYLENEAIDGVSVFGDSTMRPVPGGYEVTDFDLETIDFTRKGRSGMKSRIVSLTGESAPSEGGKKVDAKDIAALDENEIRTHAPLLVREIERKVSEPLTTKIGEMTTAAEAVTPEIDLLGQIKTLLKLSDGENPVDKLKNLLSKVEEAGSAGVKAYIKELISKKVKDEQGQALVGRLIGEMHSDYQIDGELTEDDKKKIAADFDSKVEGDEVLKKQIGEMTPARTTNDGRGGASLPSRSAPPAARVENEVVETDNIVRRKVKL